MTWSQVAQGLVGKNVDPDGLVSAAQETLTFLSLPDASSAASLWLAGQSQCLALKQLCLHPCPSA